MNYKLPQPSGLATDSPARFVAVKDRGLQCFSLDLFVPNKEDFLQPKPLLHQTALADLEPQILGLCLP